jgi:hypothetical protein
LFLVEIPLDLVAFGIKYYIPFGSSDSPHWFLHSFDAVVVIGAFVLSIGANVSLPSFSLFSRDPLATDWLPREPSEQGPLESVVSLLIVLRLWRILKLVLSIEVGNQELHETSKSLRAREKQGSTTTATTARRSLDTHGGGEGSPGKRQYEGEESDSSEKEEGLGRVELEEELVRLRKRVREMERSKG